MKKKQMISEVMAAMGRLGGKIGGKRSLETMTEEARIARARKAGKASGKARRQKAKQGRRDEANMSM